MGTVVYQVLQEMLELLRNQSSNTHGDKLEVIIIFLLVVDVVLMMFQVCCCGCLPV